jgi:2-dehydro-3-deoxygalactonokinase
VIAPPLTLMHAVEMSAPLDSQAFRDGVTVAQAAPTGLTASLFRLRAAQLLGFEQRADGAARLSALLIGSEIADVTRRFGGPGQLRLMAAGSLGALYQAALKASGFDVTMIDAEEASRRGLAKAAMNLWGAEF